MFTNRMAFFDIVEEDDNHLEYSYDALNQLFCNGPWISPFNLNSDESEDDDDDDDDDDQHIETTNELVLSQKLSQLSTGNDSLSSNSPPKKRLRTLVDDTKIPFYLRLDETHFKLWQNTHRSLLDLFDIHDIQYFMYYQYEIVYLQIQNDIYDLYLKSGRGGLDDSMDSDLGTIERCFWPHQIRKSIDNNESYETFIDERQQHNRQQIKFFECEQEKIKKENHLHWSTLIEQYIQEYVDEFIVRPLTMKRDLKISLLHYDFRSHLIERYFLMQNPTEKQIYLGNQLSDLKRKREQYRCELVELKQRLFYGKPLPSMEKCDYTQRSIQQDQLDKMILYLIRTEEQYYQSTYDFDCEWSKITDRTMSSTMINILERRFSNTSDRLSRLCDYRIEYSIKNSFVDDDLHDNESIRLCFTPSLMVDTKKKDCLDRIHYYLLNRGPSYVLPYQSYARLDVDLSIEDLLKRQFSSFKNRLAHIYSKYQINIALSMDFTRQIQQHLKDRFSLTLPNDLCRRARFERTTMTSIRKQLHKQQLVLKRFGNQQNLFYLTDRERYDLATTKAFESLTFYEHILTITNDEAKIELEVDIDEMVHSINQMINTLEHKKCINRDLARRLQLEKSQIRLAYIYFLPNIHDTNENIIFLPRFKCTKSASYKLGRFLYKLLKPFVDRTIDSYQFTNEYDFMSKLHHYTYEKRGLLSTTLFCVITIDHYGYCLTHDKIIDAMTYFIQDHSATNRIGNLSMTTIQQLLRIYLYNNHFVFKDRIYTMKKGSPMNMPLSQLLTNVYIHYWQKELVRMVGSDREMFGRHRNQFFLTWNRDSTNLEQVLVRLQQHDQNIQFRFLIDVQVQFYGALIGNRAGQLFTRVHDRSTMIERFTLPYVCQHAKFEHGYWFYSSLNRAICYCSSVDDFHNERLYLETTMLVNGYSLSFVEAHLSYFFQHYQSRRIRYCRQQSVYHSFRSRWFSIMERESNTIARLERSLTNPQEIIQLTYDYEYGSRCDFNRSLEQLWQKTFQKHPLLSKDKVKLFIGTRHRPSLNVLLSSYDD